MSVSQENVVLLEKQVPRVVEEIQVYQDQKDPKANKEREGLKELADHRDLLEKLAIMEILDQLA